MPKPELLGLQFDALDLDTAVAHCLALARSRARTSIVVTANAAHLVGMRRDPEFAEACRAADLVVADGMSVVWALRASGQHCPERVAGIDLMARLLRAAGEERLAVYLLGARPTVIATLVETLRDRYPGLAIAGWRDGFFGAAEEPGIIEAVRTSGASLLFIGMGSPLQETWCVRHRQHLGVPLAIGVGGSFDVLAGFVRRAPGPVQRLGLEWGWRLAMEPRRLWRRYLTVNFAFIGLAGREVIARRLGG